MKKISLLLSFLIILSFGCNSSILDDPTVSIKYQVPEYSHVKLTIENSYKTKIAMLVDTDQFAGTYQVNFEMTDLAEGIYFYTLEIKGIESNFYSNVTKYMMLVK